MKRKPCARCGVNERRKSHSYCGECRRAYQRQWAKDHPDKVRARNRRNYETLKRSAPERLRAQGRIKSARYRQRHPDWARESRRRWRKHHPEKRAAQKRRWYLRHQSTADGTIQKWRERNREKVREYQRQWQTTHRAAHAETERRRRARRRSVAVMYFHESELAARLSMFANRCWLCGAVATAVDHVKPLAAGGMHVLANLRPICDHCNARKGAKWPLSEKETV